MGMQKRKKEENWAGENKTVQKTGSPYIFALFLTHFWWLSPSGTVKELGASYGPITK